MYIIDINAKSYEQGEESFLRNKYKIDLIGKSLFLQDSLPSLPAPYWKVEDGAVVDMTAEEVEFYDKLELYKATKLSEYRGKRYRIEVPSSVMFASPAYPALSTRSLASSTISTAIEDRNGVEYMITYLDYIRDADKAFLESSEGFTIFDVETLNPEQDV